MSEKPKRYYQNPDERDRATPEESASEFADSELMALVSQSGAGDSRWSRRSFLKAAGFTAGAATFAACSRAPVTKAVPYLIQPEEITPGKTAWYASVCGGCEAACGALVKLRDGRPIKLEGNPAHPLSRGGLCAAGQASVLELYDSHRLKNPLVDGKETSWDEADAHVMAALEKIRREGGAVRVLTGTLVSPTLRHTINGFLKNFADAKHVSYDALSCSAILDAHARTPTLSSGRVLPRYKFENAEVIVSLDADFLGTWISPVEFTAGWRARRSPSGTPPRMSHHTQFEARMSLTGTNADRRVLVAPHDIPLLAAHLANAVALLAGAPAPFAGLSACPVDDTVLRETASRLWGARGKSLVVCGANDLAAQTAVNAVNHALGNYGATLDVERPSLQKQGDDAALDGLLAEIGEGRVGALFVHGCNPAAELPNAEGWMDAVKNVPLVAATSSHLDETARLAHVVAPDLHFLESWSDAEPVSGEASVVQPVIRPLRNARAAIESFAAWSGVKASAYDFVREFWRKEMFPRQSAEISFESFWNKTVHDGHVTLASSSKSQVSSNLKLETLNLKPVPAEENGLTLVLYPKAGILDGRHAQNPWLQELPDPVTKVVWDNYACLSPATAKRMGIAQGDVVRLSADGASMELPALIQPGQHDGAVSAALGYGRAGTGRFHDIGPSWLSGKPTVEKGKPVGANASAFLSLTDGALAYVASGIRVEKTGKKHPLACTQDYHSLHIPEKLAAHAGERRDIVRETTLGALAANPSSENAPEMPKNNLWPEREFEGHRWGMAIDLTACTGCSACVVGCQAENNVPVVGKDEVARRRDMHWMRIDRYYADADDGGADAVHQPMLCQHCGHAPCETVCPVVATASSAEGLNQQVYNRCVGTRYCANNCPYKVRRFNWFDYQKEDALENMALNPDVTVRSRGVMEKCSFCIQRIQEAKIEAKRAGVPLRDGDVKTACEQSCPSQAIVFGDLNDPESRTAKLAQDPRRYRVLAELGIEPAVSYLVKVRNREDGENS